MLSSSFKWVKLVLVILLLNACNDSFDQFELNRGDLSFSKDTVFLDTVFTGISSSTRTLKIYNRSNNNITIPNIHLGRGDNSFYRINVDGISGKMFENIDILANDSLYVFIEATIDFDQVTNPIYTDSIVFDSGENLQDVKMVTLVQDAHFLFPKRNAQGIKEKIILGSNNEGEEISVEGFYLEGSTTWKNDKPYVIYGYVGVPKNSILTIEKGVNVHFHKNSGLLVDKGGSLQVKGELEEKVVFEGDRLEPSYGNIPGQWGLIWLRSGSKGHYFHNAIIKNGTLGILMDSIGSLSEPTLSLYNTEIYNTATYGILGRSTNIEGKNLIVANNGLSSLVCAGGTFNFTHSTFANYWNRSIRQYPTVIITNYIGLGQEGFESNKTSDLIEANFVNSIIDGNQNIELLLEKNMDAKFNFYFKNSMIKFEDINGNYSDDPLYDFNDQSHYESNIINGEPHFKSIDHNEFIIGQNSDAIEKADKNGSTEVPFDILNVSRIPKSDIGAYQHIIFAE